MQVTLQPVIWEKLTTFASAEEFFEWFRDAEESLEPEGFDALAAGWRSDSAREYMEVADALQGVSEGAPPELRQSLDDGIRRLISSNENVDDFDTAAASDFCYWLSASPATVRTILDAVRATSWAEVRRLAPEDVDVMPMVEQHEAILLYAAEHGCGLLGHIG